MPAPGIAPRVAAGPTDQVELSAQRPGLPGAAASEGALGGLPGAVAALEGLKSRGFEFQRKRLVGSLGWTSSTPLQAGQALLNKDPDDLRVRAAPEGAWLPLRGPDDLVVLTAFQAGELNRLPGPELARQLELLERSGQVFEHEGQPVGAWGAYLRLTSGVSVSAAGKSLEGPEDVAMLAYLQGQLGPEALEQPELARGLRQLQEEGYRTDALELYRARAAEVPLSWHERDLGSWKPGQDPEAFCKALKEKRLAQAREQLAPTVRRPELLEPAAVELDALPLAVHPSFVDWLGRLEHPAAAARLARQEPAAQEALRNWLEGAVPGIVPQHTWAEKDGIWDDSPLAPYKNSQQSHLSLPSVNLRHVTDCTLTFRCQHALEKGHDWLVLEASSDGKNWDTLKQFTDKSDWAEHQISLVAYQGAPVELRFRLSSDSSTAGQGVGLSHLVVQGRPRFESAPRTLYQQDRSDERAALAAEVARLVAADQPLEPLQQLVAATGSAAEALRLGLPTRNGARNARLVEQLGGEAAAALAGLPGEAEPMARTFQAAGRLCPTPDDLSAVLAVYRELAELPVASQEQVSRLVQRTCPTWQTEGGWHSTADGAWSDSPGRYKHGQNASLTSPVLDLSHYSDPAISLRARFDLEPNVDSVLLEASRDGKQWERLHSFTGRSDWSHRKVSLAPFGQGTLQLRFRLKSDSSGNGEGLDMADFRLTARPSLQPDAPRELVFTDQASARRDILDQILDLARQRDLLGLERMDQLSQALSTEYSLRLLKLEASPETLIQAARAVGLEATAALYPDLEPESVQAFQLARQVANRLQQAEQLDRCLTDSRALRGVQFPESLLESLHGWQPGEWVRSEPGVWADNRVGRYRPQAKNSLISPVLSLAGQDGARLKFDYDCVLENGPDLVSLWVRREGGDWRQLKSYTGKVSQGSEELDLSDLGDARVELCWKLTSDSSTEGQGFKLRNLRVEDSTGQIFFSDRPEDLAPLHEELLTRVGGPLEPLTELVKTHGLCSALAISAVASEPERQQELASLVVLNGLRSSLRSWDEIGQLSLPELKSEVALRSECSLFRSLGVDPERLVEALRDAALDEPGRAALSKLRDGLGQAGWKPSGDWGRTLRGWSDSPGGNYKPRQLAALESPPTLVPPGARLSFETRYQFESNADTMQLEVLPEGKKDWESKARYTGTGSGRQEVDLSAYAGQTVRLRFMLRTDSSSEYPGMDFWNLSLTDDAGQTCCLDELGQRSTDGLLELACTPELQPSERSRALQILSRVPAPLAVQALRALSQLFENQEPERALALVERLPEVVLDSEPEVAMQRLLESLGPRLREESEAVLVGGVRVRKR